MTLVGVGLGLESEVNESLVLVDVVGVGFGTERVFRFLGDLVVDLITVFDLVFGLVVEGLVEVFLPEVAAFLERRELSPSIDLFFSIVYNYSIWRLN